MIGIARSHQRRLAVVGGLAAALVAVTLAVPTSAAYRTTPAAGAVQTPVGLDWDIPRVQAGTRPIQDAAYDPRSGHTYMLPRALGVKYTTGDIYVSERPGVQPVAVSLPSIGKPTSYTYELAVDDAYHKLAVLIKPDPADPLSLATFDIADDGSLTFDQLVSLVGSTGLNATGIAIDAQRGVIAVAYWWVAGSSASARVDQYVTHPTLGLAAYLSLPGVSSTSLMDVSVTPPPGEAIAVALSGGTNGCAPGSSVACRFAIFNALGAEATHANEVWFVDSFAVRRATAVGGHLGVLASFVGVEAHYLGVERDSGTVFHAIYNQSQIRRFTTTPAGSPAFAETIPISGKVRLLISGHGVVMVLLDDGSLGWLIA